MKNLSIKVRNKVIEIANVILKEGKLDEGKVIAASISIAKNSVSNGN